MIMWKKVFDICVSSNINLISKWSSHQLFSLYMVSAKIYNMILIVTISLYYKIPIQSKLSVKLWGGFLKLSKRAKPMYMEYCGTKYRFKMGYFRTKIAQNVGSDVQIHTKNLEKVLGTTQEISESYSRFWLVAAATNHIRRDWCGGLQYTLLHSHRLLVVGW